MNDIAKQIVISVNAPQPHERLGRILDILAPYCPELVAGWTLDPEDGETLVRLVELATLPPPELVRHLNKKSGVHLEHNVAMSAATVPSDPLYQDHWPFYKAQWALRKMSAEHAWSCTATMGPSVPVVVAVIDSGITRAHPDLAALVNPSSRCFIPGMPPNAFEDEDGHGTFLAGTIAAITGNGIGIASATWPVTVSLLALKFYNPWNPLSAALAAQAIAYAVHHGAKIINASWHVGMPSKFLHDHIAYAAKKDVLFVAAGGNEGTNNDCLPIWPASYSLPNIVSVMATDHRDQRPGFSNYGPGTMHIAAPGVRILSTHYYLSGVNAQPPRWREYSGTSASAAHVTAAAALVRAFRPHWKLPYVVARLLASVKKVPDLKCVAKGRLDLEKLVCGLP
jgi:subtilisin family serine protease